MIGIEANANVLADGMVMVAGDQGQHRRAAWQAKGVEEFGAPERFSNHFGQERAGVVMDDVIRPEQHRDSTLCIGVAFDVCTIHFR